MGTARRVDGRLKFVPDDCPAISMQLMRDCEGGAKDGDKVAVEILMRGNRQEDHRVGVAMRFGSSDEAKRCAKALLYARTSAAVSRIRCGKKPKSLRTWRFRGRL